MNSPGDFKISPFLPTWVKLKRLASSFHPEGRGSPRKDTGDGQGNPSTPSHQRAANYWSKHLQPLVKTTAANGQSKMPSMVSLKLQLTFLDLKHTGGRLLL